MTEAIARELRIRGLHPHTPEWLGAMAAARVHYRRLQADPRQALARAKLLTEAAAEALKVADNYRAVARGAFAAEREQLLARATGADAVMVHLISLANADPIHQSSGASPAPQMGA